MFEHAFRKALSSTKADVTTIDEYWKQIADRYQENGRHYHTLAHLEHIYESLLPVQRRIQDWTIIIFSIAYHDVIYNPQRPDNEEKSAQYAQVRMSHIGLEPERVRRCEEHILSTRRHEQSHDNDTNFFIDADLSILGSPADRYNAYAKNIRKEYEPYPDSVYIPGRKKVIQHFLQMRNIFKTAYFIDKFENVARRNLQNELSHLNAK